MPKTSTLHPLINQLNLILGTLLAITLLIFYRFAPSLITDSKEVYFTAYLGAANLLYFVTLHQAIKHKQPALSAGIQASLTGAILLVIIGYSGGLGSPYYFLWFVAIINAATFGRSALITITSLTTLYYGYFVLVADKTPRGSSALAYLIQFIMTLGVAFLADWALRHLATQTSSAAPGLAMQLGQEQFQAQTLLNSMGEGAVVVNSNLQIQVWNPAAVNMLGWNAADAMGLNYLAVMKLTDSKDVEIASGNDPFQKAWRDKATVVKSDLTATTKGGRKLPLSMTVSPIYDTSGNITGGIALFRDITQEKENQRQKDEFISTASHEMRTPVAAIEGYLALALNPKTATIDQRAKQYLDKAHINTQHLGELFRDLLSITKLEENVLAGKVETFELSNMVSEVVDSLQFGAQKKGVTLKFIPGFNENKVISPLYYVSADPARVREVVTNLIDNALKFTARGGVTVTLSGTADDVTVGVSDTGMGIAPEDISHLFQKFYRIDNSATRTIGGTGLGLYLCRSIIERFQGKIWAESELGRGSKFSFMLPRVKSPESQPILTPLSLRENQPAPESNAPQAAA